MTHTDTRIINISQLIAALIAFVIVIPAGTASAQKKRKPQTNKGEPLRIRCKSENPASGTHNMSGIAYLDATIFFFDTSGEPLELTTDGADGYITNELQPLKKKYQIGIKGNGYAAVIAMDPERSKWAVQGPLCNTPNTMYNGSLANEGISIPGINDYYSISDRTGSDLFVILLSNAPFSCNDLTWVDSIATDYGRSFGKKAPARLGASRLEKFGGDYANRVFRSINVSSTDGGRHYTFVYCKMRKQ